MKQMMTAPGCDSSGNQYAWFRAEFPAGARLSLFAVDFYELWNNGARIAYGPAKSGPPLLYCDRLSLEGGRSNHVALLVYARRGAPKIWCESPGFVPRWRALRSAAFDPASPYTIGDAGFTEYFDLDSGEEHYRLPGFDDSAWPEAVPAETIPENQLQERPIPYFRETERAPMRVTRGGGEILVDFGEMVYGRLELVGRRTDGEPLRVEYIEDPERGWAHAENRRAMYADKLTGRAGEFSWRSFAKRGFRMVALAGSNAELDRISLFEYGYPWDEPAGSFRCSDESLNRLWRISERTLKICMDDILNDCPHRDQAQWMDAFVSARMALSLRGVTDLTRKCILQHALCSFRDGALLSPSICGWQFMPDYAMVQICFLLWYCRISGDWALAAALWDRCVSGVGCMRRFRQEDGLLADVEGAYLDNAFELCRLGKSAAMNAVYIAALKAMAELAARLKRASEAAAYQAEAETASRSFRRCFERPDGTLRDASERPEVAFLNYNFSCEFGGRYQGKTARARFEFREPSPRRVTLKCGAFGPYRVVCNGEILIDDRRPAAWERPLPAYAPEETVLDLRAGVNTVVFEAECNFLNWDLYFAADGVDWGEGELSEFDPETGEILSAVRRAAPRHWEPPAISQTTYGYAAFAGLIGRDALRDSLRETYCRNYISVRVPLFCTETADAAKLKGWVLSPNTPWTMFYYLTGLFENGLDDEAFALLRRAWGVMLDRGAVNTWEEWNCNSSLCHAWGASPCWFFHREILGVKHEALDRGEVLIRPALFGLDSASGRVMLGGGEWVEISLRREEGRTLVGIRSGTRRRIVTDFSKLDRPVCESCRHLPVVGVSAENGSRSEFSA